MKHEILGLIRDCATDLPKDVEDALTRACKRESGTARDVLDTILENVRLARGKSMPMCQDTGTLIFYVTTPPKYDRSRIRKDITEAVRQATETVPLRQNSVNPLTGMNEGVNVPVIHFSEWEKDKVRFELMLKGGGSENMTHLYNLPDARMDAGRDLEGVVRCTLDAVHDAQGKGCPPYIIGVGIGGLADTAIALSKEQLMRRLDDVNVDRRLVKFEKKLLERINSLGIGPMGLGGKTTALAVRVGCQPRHPASYFVGVSLMCWACRRRSVEVGV
ncbi:MAG: fumarate hydratase [Candidatus Altiarchaeota archaeon]